MTMLKPVVEDTRTIREEQKRTSEEIKGVRKGISEIAQNQEKEKRKKNIVVQGIKINENKQSILREAMKNFMDKELGVRVEVNTVRKLREEIAVVELNNIQDKMKIMENKNKLKNRNDEPIYINDDRTKKERIVQKEE